MQIILISRRTLGASEALLLLFLFSHLFFFLTVVCFLAVIVVVFEVLLRFLLHLLLHSNTAIASLLSLLPSGLVVGLRCLLVLSSPHCRPSLYLRGEIIHRRVMGEMGGEDGWRVERFGVPVPLFGTSAGFE